MIANHEKELFAHLDQRVESRLQNRISIKFEPYRHGELVSILQDRVHWGLAEDAVSKDGIDQIAEAASGDARVAIGILRNAAQKADREGMDQIPARVIESVVPEAKTEIKQSAVDRLNEDQRVLYETIREYGSITPRELYREYERRVEATKTKRMVRNYLSKMQHYNHIIAEGNTRGRTYRLVS